MKTSASAELSAPGTYAAALSSAEAEVFIYQHRTLAGLLLRREGAYFGAGRVVTMHAAARDGNLNFLPLVFHRHMLHESPVAWGEAGSQSSFFRPVFVVVPRPVIPYVLL